MKNKLKNVKGITLIALVITIIVLLILAGVTVVTLTGENGLFSKAQLAKEKNIEAEQDEKNKLDSYENEINSYVSNNRGTVTLTEEEYARFKNQFSKNGNVSISKPNTWTVGTEYDFGDGVYGQRFTGTFTAEANNASNAKCRKTIPVGNIDYVMSFGGYWVFNSSNNHKQYFCGAAITMGSNITGYRSSEISTCDGNLYVQTTSAYDRTNAPYDLWVLYTKNQTN